MQTPLLPCSNNSSKLFQSMSDSRFLYMFLEVNKGSDYILYRIDALKHLHDNEQSCNTDATQQQLNDLKPLLVFLKHPLPPHCYIAKLGSNFYFLKGRMFKPTFGFKDAKDTDVYMMRESDIMDIDPSEHNVEGDKYLIKIASMNGTKTFEFPIVFVAENKLYVLSSKFADTQFEVYCPESKTWRVLPPSPYPKNVVISHVVVGKTVYFNVRGDGLLSFQLEEEKWGNLVTGPPPCPNLAFANPILSSPLVITGDMVFGFLGDSQLHLTVCASPLPRNGEFTSPEFMQPSIAPDDEFSNALASSRCPHMIEKKGEFFTGYMIALDGGKVLCVVSYGSGSVTKNGWNFVDPKTSYATLTFFEVTPGFYRDESRGHASNVDCANEMVDGKYVATRYFKAKLLHSAQFIIKTSNLYTFGQIKACFC